MLENVNYEQHLIANTTKEQRRKSIAIAEGIASLSGTAESEENTKLYQKYIDGEMELFEVHNEILDSIQKIASKYQ